MSITRAPRPESNFYVLDKAISQDKRLSWAARGLLIYLLGKPDNWQVSIEDLRNQTKDSSKPSGRDAVYGFISELIEAGYMKRTQGRAGAGGFSNTQYEVSESPLPGLPYTGLPYTANPTLTSTDKKQILTENKPLLADERFAEFWKQYPNKKAKPAAERLWKKINPDDKTFTAIMSGLSRHKSSRAWLKDNGEFIPHPATWLNGRRWEDEIGAAQQGDKHSGFSGQRDYNQGTTRNSDGTLSF